MEESVHFSRLSDELGVILESKPDKWLNIRLDVKSDTSAEKSWQRTDDGKREMVLRLKLKAIEKSMSSIRTRLRILSDEARNLF